MNVSQRTIAPVAAAIRPPASRPSGPSAAPPRRTAVRRPLVSAVATAAIVSSVTGVGSATGNGGAGRSASPHATSAGRISVATWWGACIAACTARAASAATERALVAVCTQPDTLRATPAMSLASGAS